MSRCRRSALALNVGPDAAITLAPSVNCASELAGPERLVGLGFRYWMAGYQTGDIRCWEECWNLHAAELGSAAARRVVTDLSCWVRSITAESQRTIEVFPGPCRVFCRDECTAVALIAALQHGGCPGVIACARALLATDACEHVLEEGHVYARSLAFAGQELGRG